MKKLVLSFLIIFLFTSSYSQKNGIYRVCDLIHLPIPAPDSLFYYHIVSEKQLKSVLSPDTGNLPKIDFQHCQLVGFETCEEFMNMHHGVYLKYIPDSSRPFVIDTSLIKPYDDGCDNKKIWFLIRKKQTSTLPFKPFENIGSLDYAKQMVIDSDSIYKEYASKCNLKYIENFDFNKWTIWGIYHFADANASFEYELITDKKNKTIRLMAYVYDGGSAGMNFFMQWIRFEKLPPGYEYNIEEYFVKRDFVKR